MNDYNWRVRVRTDPSGELPDGATWYFPTREDAEAQAELVSFADPRVEGYVCGVGWTLASRIAREFQNHD